MQKYDVHMFAIVRVKVADVEAESMVQAINKVTDEGIESGRVLYRLFERLDGYNGLEVEFADQYDGFLVDLHGDPHFEQSKRFKADGVTLDSLLLSGTDVHSA